MSAKGGYLCSIGHGGQTCSDLIARLRSGQIQFVIDVRSVPYSRFQPDFSKSSLEACLKAASIKYVYMGDLLGGRPPDDDCYSNGRVDYEKVRSKNFFLQGLTRLKTAHLKGLRVCLLCSERLPHRCHRSKLIGPALKTLGLELHHLLPDGKVLTQDAVMAELTGRQATLFNSPLFSRKQYRTDIEDDA